MSSDVTLSAIRVHPELENAYRDNRATLLRFLSGRLDDRHGAEDLAQDLYVAIAQLRPGEPIRSPRSLLFRIAGNLAISFNGKEARRAALRKSQVSVLWTAVDDVTPERHLLGSNELALIERAVSDLPDRTRQILAWRRIDGTSTRDIAERLSISTQAVEKHLRKAMAHLQAALDEPPAGE